QRARVHAARFLPGRAAVVGTIQAALTTTGIAAGAAGAATTAAPTSAASSARRNRVARFRIGRARTAPTRRRRRFDRRVDDVAVLAISINADAAEWAGG